MDDLIKKLTKRKNDLEKSLKSYNLVYPPIDHKKIADEIIKEIDDAIEDIHIEDALGEIGGLKYVWIRDNNQSRIVKQYSGFYERNSK